MSGYPDGDRDAGRHVRGLLFTHNPPPHTYVRAHACARACLPLFVCVYSTYWLSVLERSLRVFIPESVLLYLSEFRFTSCAELLAVL